MATSDNTVSLDSTIRAFDDGLTNLSTDAAISVLDGWTDKINASGRKDLEGIAQLLQQISGLLQNRPVPGRQIGDLLKRVGAHTAEVASTADGDAEAEQLRKLGGLCKAAGTALAGDERTGDPEPYASYSKGDTAADNLQSLTKADRLADTDR